MAEPYHPVMDKRTDVMTAARVDATIILLPLIGWMEATRTLAANSVPVEVAARVMTMPMARRKINIMPPGAFLA